MDKKRRKSESCSLSEQKIGQTSPNRVHLLTCTDNPCILPVSTVMDSPTIEVARGQGGLTPSTVDIVHPDLACPLTKSCPSGSTRRSSVAQLTTDNLGETRSGLM